MRPDRYDRLHCNVSLVILFSNFYLEFTRSAPDKLQLSSYNVIIRKKQSVTDVFNLLRSFSHLGLEYSAAPS